MTTDEQLRDAFGKLSDNAKQAQLRWVTVDRIDRDKKTMDVTGIVDGLGYYDVQLGLSSVLPLSRNRHNLPNRNHRRAGNRCFPYLCRQSG